MSSILSYQTRPRIGNFETVKTNNQLIDENFSKKSNNKWFKGSRDRGFRE